MKHVKKILALVIAAMMIMAMGVTVFAAEGDPKTITITSPAELAVNETTTYYIYKVFNATSNGTNSNISYTKLSDKSLPLTATDGSSKFDEDSAGNIHYYTKSGSDWTEDTTATELTPAMIAAISSYVAEDTPVENVTITGPSTKATVELDDYGYYFITTTTGTVVTIDSTNPSASVSDKNEVPSVDKKITGISNNGTVEADPESKEAAEIGRGKIGDIVTYEVTVHAKKGAVNYIFHDKISAGLSLEAQSTLSVKVAGTEIAATNYQVQYWNDTDATTEPDTETGDNITIRFSNEYLATLTANTDIVISYQVKINDNAVIASAGNPNTVVLDYGHDPTKTDEDEKKEPTKKTEEDTVTVYTYALALKKVNKEGTPLDGATFRLPFYVQETPDANGAYIYAGTTAGEGLVNELTTTTTGEITIKGVQNVAYTFEETVAPKGYNKLTSTFSITPVITAATATTTNTTIWLDEDGNIVDAESDEATTEVTYTNNNMAVGGFQAVVNMAGTELPSTGGIGTTIFYIVGGILILGAVIFLITRRRMNHSDK